MAPIEIASIKMNVSLSSFLPVAFIRLVYAASDAKDLGIREGLKERSYEFRIDDHVIVQENKDVPAGVFNSQPECCTKRSALLSPHEPNLGKLRLQELGGSVDAGVIDDDDFMCSVMPAYGIQQRRQ